jgi:dGTPase
MHQLASDIIGETVGNIYISDNGYLLSDSKSLAVIEMLKEMTWYYVIKRASLSSAQRGQALLIRELYHALIGWVEEESDDLELIAEGTRRFDPRQFPARLIDYLNVSFSPGAEHSNADYTPKQRVSRAVVDYIVSLTEAQAVALSARLAGTSQRSMIEGWLQT